MKEHVDMYTFKREGRDMKKCTLVKMLKILDGPLYIFMIFYETYFKYKLKGLIIL